MVDVNCNASLFITEEDLYFSPSVTRQCANKTIESSDLVESVSLEVYRISGRTDAPRVLFNPAIASINRDEGGGRVIWCYVVEEVCL